MAQPLYRRHRSTRLLMVALVTASLVTITVDYRGGQSGPLEAAGRAALAIISPLQRATSNLLQPVGDFFSTVSHLGSLRAENETLKTEMAKILSQSGDVLSLRAQNDQLLKLLRIQESLDVPAATGRVIAFGVSNFEWTVTINVGSRVGVQAGMPVVAPDGLIGHVVRTTGNSADVQLIIDPDSAVAGRLVSSQSTGLLTGQRDHDLHMVLVKPDVEVHPGEPVETAGYTIGNLGSLYPAHIQIGVVSLVRENAAALQKEVWVRPNVDFSSLEYVTVLITPNP